MYYSQSWQSESLQGDVQEATHFIIFNFFFLHQGMNIKTIHKLIQFNTGVAVLKVSDMRLFLRRWPWILIVLVWSQCRDSWMYHVQFPLMIIYECVKHSSEHLILTITTLCHVISVYDYNVVHVSIVWILFALLHILHCAAAWFTFMGQPV
jgi:hypothetical protein